MNLWLISPAWRRPAITRLALAQRRQLCDDLATSGVSANCIVIADDENLDIAREFGFPTIEMENELGARFNAGFKYAAEQGADYLAPIGSDDWVHADYFADLRPDEVRAGRCAFIVNVLAGVGCRLLETGKRGSVPWIIPRQMLSRYDFSPVRPDAMRGIDWWIAQALPKPTWHYYDPNPLRRVGWKSDVGLTTYEGMAYNFGRGEVDPWPLLSEHYPADLVSLARETHELLADEEMVA